MFYFFQRLRLVRSKPGRPKILASARAGRLRLEPLEDRRLLTVFYTVDDNTESALAAAVAA